MRQSLKNLLIKSRRNFLYGTLSPYWIFRLSTAKYRVLPDFLIIGAQRSGTSTLYTLLRMHPYTKGVPYKELHFFNSHYEKGHLWYRAHFPLSWNMRAKNGIPKLLTGEKTPAYLAHPEVPKRVKNLIPDVKLIVMLRNPIDRAYSHYNMCVRDGWENLPFEEALDSEEKRLREVLNRFGPIEMWKQPSTRFFLYKYRGHYAEHLKRWFEFFPRDQILVLKSEDYFDNPVRELLKIQEFLGLPLWEPPWIPRPSRSKHPPISQKAREKLKEYFRPLNQDLYKLLDMDFGWD